MNMGACSFIKTAYAGSAREAFDSLVKDAIREYGDNSYNGTISTCSYGGTVMRFDKYSKSNEDKAYKLIEEDGYGEKWDAKAIDLGIVHYEVTTIKKVSVKKEKPKWTMMYVVHYGGRTKLFKTKTESDAEAMKLLKNGESDVYVSKEYVNTVKGSEVVSEFKIEKKKSKTKPKSLKPNQTYNEIHKYMFYGFAAE